MLGEFEGDGQKSEIASRPAAFFALHRDGAKIVPLRKHAERELLGGVRAPIRQFMGLLG